MTKADSVHSTPRILTPQFPPPPFRSKPVTIFDIAVHQLQAMLDLHRMRRQAEREVERLIAFLDMTDGFTLSEREEAVDDVPCDDDEREFSFSGVSASGQFSIGFSEDELETSCLNGLEADDEPSLGSLEDHPNGYRDGSDVSGRKRSQEWWGSSATDDTEDQCEDEGAYDGDDDKSDDEPSLGWPERIVQGVSVGGFDDQESSLPVMGGAA